MQLVVFVAGAVLMSLEMLGSRILAPFFGTSIFVWGSLISVFLASLSVGYFVGGALADKRPSRSSLVMILTIPGVMVGVLPWFSGPINTTLANADLGPRSGPLLAALALFFVPSVFMGMVSPFAIKLQVKGLDSVGNTAGTLSAISTLGSIVGTLGTSFFLIAWLGVRTIVHLLGVVLLLLAVGVAVQAHRSSAQRAPTPKRKSKRQPGKGSRASKTLLVLALCGLALGHSSSVSGVGADLYASRVVYDRDSLYHHILVADEGGLRYLKFDASWQSAMDLRDPVRLVFDYTSFFHLGPLLQPEARTALFVGLGGGSVQKSFRVNYPDLVMDVAEIDPEVIRVAALYFDVKADKHLRLYAEDGRTFLRKNKTRYDLVFLDAYFADSIPFHLATKEYLTEISKHMEPGGLVISNIIGAVTGPKSRLFRSMYKTYEQVFSQVYAFPVGWSNPQYPVAGERNIVVIGVVGEETPSVDWAEVAVRAQSMMASLKVPSDLSGILRCRVASPIKTDDVPVLTDDYAPVDALIHFQGFRGR